MKKIILGLTTVGLLSTSAFAEMSQFMRDTYIFEAQGFCEGKWDISLGKKDATSAALRKIGEKSYMKKCISIRLNKEAESSDEIAKKVIQYYKK